MRSFEHAAASRDLAEAVVVHAVFDTGREGWGECLPRPYVTGETLDGVVVDLEQVLWPALGGLDLGGPAGLAAIPRQAAGRCINSAACAVELATIDAGADGTGGDVSGQAVRGRVCGVLGSANPAKTLRRLRLMWWFGLRQFKLKLGMGTAVDHENLRLVHQYLRRPLMAGKAVLRVDVNGGWTMDETPDRVAEMAAHNVKVVEQPVYCGAQQLVELAGRCRLPLMADESLLTPADARIMAASRNIWFNVRISKNGGITRAREIIRLAQERGVPVVVGAMVGESGLLSAAQRRLLQAAFMHGDVMSVEGNYGRLLLKDDLTTRSPRFGYGGRLKPLKGPGLGVTMDPRKLQQYAKLVKTLGC